MSAIDSPFLTIEETAKYLKRSVSWLYERINPKHKNYDPEFPVRQVHPLSPTRRVFLKADVEKFVASRMDVAQARTSVPRNAVKQTQASSAGEAKKLVRSEQSQKGHTLLLIRRRKLISVKRPVDPRPSATGYAGAFVPPESVAETLKPFVYVSTCDAEGRLLEEATFPRTLRAI